MWSWGFLLLFSINLAQAEHPKTDPKVESWVQGMEDEAWRRIDQLGEKLNDVLFNQIENLKIYNFNNDNFDLGLGVHRRVFDNMDLANSWTVVDRFEITGMVPLFSENVSISPDFGPLGFSIGAGFGLEFVDIRQVKPQNYPDLPSIENRTKNIDEAKTWVSFVQDNGNKPLSVLPQTPEDNARFGNLLNLVLFPFRLPVSADSVSWMQNGEIISYIGTGSIQVGANVGWSLDPTGATSLFQVGASYTTFVNGSFRVSVQREDDRFVRLKVTRASSFGHSVSAGGYSKPNFLDGIIVVKNLTHQLKIIPFQVSATQSIGDAFDIGYRYDLTNPHAREAYERAFFGRLAQSEELASDATGVARDFNITGVQKIFTRDSKLSNVNSGWKLQIGFLLTKTSSQTLSSIDSVITLPDGTHKVFQSRADNTRDWKLFSAFYEKFRNSFIVNIDLDKYAKDHQAPDAFTFTFEGQIEDSDTKRDDLINYILQVEDAVAQPGMFPRPPPRVVASESPIPLKNGFIDLSSLGRSRFYYRVDLPNAAVSRLIATPEEKMWSYLEKAFHVDEGSWQNWDARLKYFSTRSIFSLFNIPLFLAGINIREGSDLTHAELVYNRWQRLKHTHEVKELSQNLAKMFFDRLYGYELASLVRSVLDQEPVAFYTSGYNPIFGRIVKDGNTNLRFDNIATKIEREIEFDRGQPRIPVTNPDDGVSGFASAQTNDTIIELKFTLKTIPRAAVFQLIIDNAWWWPPWKMRWPWDNGTLTDLLYHNNSGVLKAGENKLVLNTSDATSDWYELAKNLKPGNRYLMRMAVNSNGIHWGPIAEINFKFKQPD